MNILPQKIGWRIFFTFTVLLVLLAVGGGFGASWYADRVIHENAANELRVISVTVARRVQRQLDRIERGLTSLEQHGALVTELDRYTAGRSIDRAKLEGFLTDRLTQLPLFVDLAVFAKDGSCIGSTNASWYEISARSKQFFVAGLRAFSFTEMFTTESGTVQLVTTPVSNGYATLGVLVGQVNLDVIYELMDQSLDEYEDAEAFLLDAGLRYITSGRTGSADLSESHLNSTPLVQHLNEEFWVGMYENSDGDRVLGTSIRIPGRQWYVVLERAYDLVSKPINQIRLVIFLATIGLVLVLVFSTWLLSRSITRPLQNLVDSARHIAAGDYDTPVVGAGVGAAQSLLGGEIFEVGFLAREIDGMRLKIRDYQSMLLSRLEDSERRLGESERLAAIGTLAATLAHEIRNPLNAMSLLLARIELQAGRDNSAKNEINVGRDTVKDLHNEIRRLDRLVTDMLDYAKPLTLQLRPIDVCELVESVSSLYMGVSEARRIELRFQPTESVKGLMIVGDSDRLKQCLNNLIQNALDACSDGLGKIKLEVVDRITDVAIEISDNGVGIPKGDETRIFDLFFTTKQQGTGLGLSTVRKIISAHGGTISIQSDSGEAVRSSGTAVVITLRKLPESK